MTTNNELFKSLVKAQLEISPPGKDKKNPHFKSDYCSLDSIYAACRIPLAQNGLSLSHTVEMMGERYFLKTILYHTSGENISNLTPMFIDKLTSQGYQSANTYARRSAITSLLGLPTEEDDDGNEATNQQSLPAQKPVHLNPAQLKTIEELIGDDMSMMNNVLSHHKVDRLNKILASDFQELYKNLKDAVKQ